MKTYYGVHGIGITFVAEAECLHQRLREDYGAFEVPVPPAGVQMTVVAGGSITRMPAGKVLTTDAGDQVVIADRRIHVGGPSVASKAGYEKSVRPYLTTMVSGLLSREHAMERFHASAVATDGGAVMFIGQSGSGKTSTCLKWVIEGAAYMSHEFLFLGRAGNDVMVCGMPQALTFGEGAVRWFGLDKQPGISAAAEELMYGPEGHEKLRLPIDRIVDGARTQLRAPLRRVVLVKPNLGLSAPRGYRLPPEVAGAMLLQSVEPPFKYQYAPLPSFERYCAATAGFIQEIIRKVPCYHMQWCRDHDANYAAMRALLDSEDVCRSSAR